MAWALRTTLLGQAAAVALTALSACAVASYLVALAPARLVKIAVVTMAALDAALVFSRALTGPNNTLNAAAAPPDLPHLQVGAFGSALIGYGGPPRRGRPRVPPRGRIPPMAVELLVLGLSAAFDPLFLTADELPATVPIALALLLVEARARRRATT
ncbi:MAG: hypothetical protein J2P57_17345 [Acidimicrobiaceae bacterium]|nr:hypothetical protein [Acidimicrobiaceae bacterium]